MRNYYQSNPRASSFFPLKYIMKPINFSDPHTHLIFISKKVFFEFLFSSFNLDDDDELPSILLRSYSPNFLIRYAIGDPHIFKYKKNCARSQLSNFFRQNEIGLLITQKTNFWSFDRLKPWDRNSQAWNIQRLREGGKKNHFLNHKNFARSIFKNRLCCCFFLTINSSSCIGFPLK